MTIKKYEYIKYLGFIFLLLGMGLAILIILTLGDKSMFLWIPAVILFLFIPTYYTGTMLELVEKNPLSFQKYSKLYLIVNIVLIFLGFLLIILGTMSHEISRNWWQSLAMIDMGLTAFYAVSLNIFIKNKVLKST